MAYDDEVPAAPWKHGSGGSTIDGDDAGQKRT